MVLIKVNQASNKLIVSLLVALVLLAILAASESIDITALNNVQWNHVFRSKAHLVGRSNIHSSTRSHPDTIHRIVFAIKQKNVDRLEDILMDVSDPSSKRYGHHWTRDELGQFTENREGSDAVLSFLQNHFHSHELAVEKRSPFDEYIVVNAKVKVLERLFNTEFYQFSHRDWDNKVIHRAMEYSIPEELDAHIESVGNVADFPVALFGKPVITSNLGEVKKKVSASSLSASSGVDATNVHATAADSSVHRKLFDNGFTYSGYVTPATLRETYSIFNGTGNYRVRQAVYSTNGDQVSGNDLASFQYNFGVPTQTVYETYHGTTIANACKESLSTCVEPNLDFQYMMSTGQNVPTVAYHDDYSYWYQWLVDVASWDDSEIPDVFSMSYGGYEITVSADIRYIFNLESMKLGIRGVTLLASSGDDGVVGYYGRDNYLSCGYYAMFPACSPYWTSVGATMGPESGNTEVTCSASEGSAITTGGGFSYYSTAPSWQTTAIADYFSTVDGTSYEPVSGYNATNRAYPDISLMGNNYLVVLNGSFYAVSGTSASSPAMAGMISVLNSRRKAAGKSTMGFINPFLYANYASFVIDITSGNNSCTASSTVCCDEGFAAVSGWDPATGLGSVNFTLLYEAAMSSSSTSSPTRLPTETPTLGPGETYLPSKAPTRAPTKPPTRAPTESPTKIPTKAPSRAPTKPPTRTPTYSPTLTNAPTKPPTMLPTIAPTKPPTFAPSDGPSQSPSFAPTKPPTLVPTNGPTYEATQAPSRVPTYAPSKVPTREPTAVPSKTPTQGPSLVPTKTPTLAPSLGPTQPPSFVPTKTPTKSPTLIPTNEPTLVPTRGPTHPPSLAPSNVPTVVPTKIPTQQPTVVPSKIPTKIPTKVPTKEPTQGPSKVFTVEPTLVPSKIPTEIPTKVPTKVPTQGPSKVPTREPSATPTKLPTNGPTKTPTRYPTFAPSKLPTKVPTKVPTREPTVGPSKVPTRAPTFAPTKTPTQAPTKIPTREPTCGPSKTPTKVPTVVPTREPTVGPSKAPTRMPTFAPSKTPTEVPTKTPTKQPTLVPTKTPTEVPTFIPTKIPTETPSKAPTYPPSFVPTKTPTGVPTKAPTRSPTYPPTKTPTAAPSYSRTPTVVPTKAPTQSPSVAAAAVVRKLDQEDVSAITSNGMIPTALSSTPVTVGIIAFVGLVCSFIYFLYRSPNNKNKLFVSRNTVVTDI